MEIYNNIPPSSLGVNPSTSPRRTLPINSKKDFKDAFKLDINPRYLSKTLEDIAIFDEEALYYTKASEIVRK